MNRTIETQSAEELPLPARQPLPNLLLQGFQLALRSWPLVVWAYAINLIFGLLAAIPFAAGLASYLDHSLAAQRIAGTIDVTYLGELAVHLRDTSLFPVALHTAGWLNLLQVLVLFFLFAGTVFIYVSAEPPRFSVLLRGGAAYFWRFVRAAVMVGCVSAFILGILFTARAALLVRLSRFYVERHLFYYSLVTGAVVVLAALLLRLWFDLVEVYVVRNAMDGERYVRYSLLPALRMLSRYFFRAVGSFLLIGVAGVGCLALCLYLWNRLVPAHQVWLACLVGQLGLFLMLASRFWQRGFEAALVMSADPPIIAAEEIAPLTEEEEEIPSPTGVAAPGSLSEPTLSELLVKLRTEPWATPEATTPPTPLAPAPPAATAPEPASPEAASVSSLLDRHVQKFPLGGPPPGQEAGNAAAPAVPPALPNPPIPPVAPTLDNLPENPADPRPRRKRFF